MHYTMIHDPRYHLQHMRKKLKQSSVLVCVLTDHEMYRLVTNGDFIQLESLSDARFDIKFALTCGDSDTGAQGDIG